MMPDLLKETERGDHGIRTDSGNGDAGARNGETNNPANIGKSGNFADTAGGAVRAESIPAGAWRSPS